MWASPPLWVRTRAAIHWLESIGRRTSIARSRQFGSFDRYLWSFVDGRPIVNRPRTRGDVPAHTPLSDRISKDLKQRGFGFVGTTIVYAYLQAVGVVNDHARECFLAPKGARPRKSGVV